MRTTAANISPIHGKGKGKGKGKSNVKIELSSTSTHITGKGTLRNNNKLSGEQKLSSAENPANTTFDGTPYYSG
jgi:hypothetical protein